MCRLQSRAGAAESAGPLGTREQSWAEEGQENPEDRHLPDKAEREPLLLPPVPWAWGGGRSLLASPALPSNTKTVTQFQKLLEGDLSTTNRGNLLCLWEGTPPVRVSRQVGHLGPSHLTFASQKTR